MIFNFQLLMDVHVILVSCRRKFDVNDSHVVNFTYYDKMENCFRTLYI